MLTQIGRIIRRYDFWFWIFAGAVLWFAIYFRKRMSLSFDCFTLSIDEDHLPNIVLLWALVATTIYTYAFLLASILERRHTIFPREQTSAGSWFHVMYWFSAGFALVVALGYGISFIVTTCHATSNAVTAATAELKGGFVPDMIWAIVSGLYHVIVRFHLLFFVVLFSFLDFMIYQWAVLNRDREIFGEILFAVDFPIIASMFFIELLMKTGLSDVSAIKLKFLEAGVVAFQLIAGGLVLCVLEALRDGGEGFVATPPTGGPGPSQPSHAN